LEEKAEGVRIETPEKVISSHFRAISNEEAGLGGKSSGTRRRRDFVKMVRKRREKTRAPIPLTREGDSFPGRN